MQNQLFEKDLQMEIQFHQDTYEREVIVRHMLKLPRMKYGWVDLLKHISCSKRNVYDAFFEFYALRENNYSETYFTVYNRLNDEFPANQYSYLFYIPITNVICDLFKDSHKELIDYMCFVRDSMNSCIENYTYPIEEIFKQTVLCWNHR